MPGRRSHGTISAQSTKTRKPRSNTKKSLNALSIASGQTNERRKKRSHRLGELAEGEDGQARTGKPKLQQLDDLENDGGSDSEGNEWRLGEVDSDDDSALDSDEAFGESDEERFEGFTFRGSESNKSKGSIKIEASRDSITGQRGHIAQGVPKSGDGGMSDGEDLGEDAVDLGDLLDVSEEDSRSEREEDSDGDETEKDNDTVLSLSDTEVDSHESSKLSKLQSLVESLEGASAERGPKRRRIESAAESYTPSEYAVTSSKKLTLEDMLSSVNDPIFKNSLKILDPKHKSKSSRSNSGIPGKLEVPLAKRQQDRIDRTAAYAKSKETLDRWIDTVKHNRRAEHISFPVVDPEAPSASTGKRLAATSSSAPFNEFEQKIQIIMQESGLGDDSGKKEEERLQAFEELETRKLPLEEVQARRAQLRIARELLYREEIRAKRIKKIKSRSYRRVHRKQREKQDEEERTALAAAGVQLSGDEQEAHERRRAEERMGAKHRESRWANGVKESGRAAWDDDTRQAVVAMAQRNDELRRRISGKVIRNEDGDPLRSTDEDSEEDADSDSEIGQADRLLRKLNDLEDGIDSEAGEKKGLRSMKFMQRAEANRKQENDDATERLRRELLGENPYEDNDSTNVAGRRVFGPRSATEARASDTTRRAGTELDEGVLSGDELSFKGFESERSASPRPSLGKNERHVLNGNQSSLVKIQNFQAKGTDTSTKAEKRKRAQSSNSDKVLIDIHTIPQLSSIITKEQSKRLPTSQDAPESSSEWQTITVPVDDTSSEAESESGSNIETQPTTSSLKNSDLIKRAFAGDDVLQQFKAEKTQAMSDEEEKTIDKTLPGWGSWTGEGLSKKAQRRNYGKVLEKKPGVAKEKRKDAKLERVLINEKQVKKNMKYLASSLPHPFETRQQYERSLRLPVGPEWTTKETFQAATKPRVLIKQGVISPMSRPIL